jgi:arylsulfatase A-like enzyme
MHSRNAIVIAIDGLRASALGAYGNTWHPTPALDALASQSLVLDWMYCREPTPQGFYRDAWQAVDQSLSKRLGALGIQAALTTDDGWAAEKAQTTDFTEIQRIEIDGADSAATVADTQMARLFALAVDQLASWKAASSSTPGLLWVHAGGFYAAWDAPLELRQALLDEDDLAAPRFVAPPVLVAVEDHDALLLCRAAYAAQTMVLDECVGALAAALTELELDQNTLVILIGVRGYALGEHSSVGGLSLYGELLHVPCLVRIPGLNPPSPRSPQLAQPADVAATLLDWFEGSPLPGERGANSALSFVKPQYGESARQFVVALGQNGERVIRTPAWMLRQAPHDRRLSGAQTTPGIELYVKPDDRWEANEVAARCPDVAARLLALLDRAESEEPLPSLDKDLFTPLR